MSPTSFPTPVTIISDLPTIYKTYDQTLERRDGSATREQLYQQYIEEHQTTVDFLDMRDLFAAPSTANEEENPAEWWAGRTERYEQSRLTTLTIKAERTQTLRSIANRLGEIVSLFMGVGTRRYTAA